MDTRGDTKPVRSVNGREIGGSIREPHRILLIVGSVGLTGLNMIWLGKILSGVWKVLARGRRHGCGNHQDPDRTTT